MTLRLPFGHQQTHMNITITIFTSANLHEFLWTLWTIEVLSIFYDDFTLWRFHYSHLHFTEEVQDKSYHDITVEPMNSLQSPQTTASSWTQNMSSVIGIPNVNIKEGYVYEVILWIEIQARMMPNLSMHRTHMIYDHK